LEKRPKLPVVSAKSTLLRNRYDPLIGADGAVVIMVQLLVVVIAVRLLLKGFARRWF